MRFYYREQQNREAFAVVKSASGRRATSWRRPRRAERGEEEE